MLIHSSLLELYEISIFAGPKWLNICTFTWLNSKCTQNVQCFYVSSHLTLTALRGSRHSSEENEARRGKTHCQHLLPLLPVWGVSLRPELVAVRNWQELTRLVNYMALMLGLSFPAGKWGHHLCTVHGGEQLWGNDFAEVMPVNTPCKQRGRHSDVWYHF